MAAVTSLGTPTFATASGTETVTATPAVGDLIVIITACSGSTAKIAPTDNNSSGTYVLAGTCVKASSADTMNVWVRTALIASAVSTIFTSAPGTTTGGGLFVLKVTGMTRIGLNAVRQSAIQSNQAASGTPAPVLGSVPLSANPIIGAVFNATSPATMTPRASYTEFSDLGYSSPTSGCEDMAKNSGETSATITWGGTSASAFCSIALELDSGSDAVPTLVQEVTGPQSELISVNNALSDYIIQLPNPAGAGNCIVVAVSHDNGSAATETVTDDKSNTYTLIKRISDTTKGQFASVFAAFNATAGARTITVTFSTTTVAIFGAAAEFYNVSTALAAIDVSNGNFSSGTSVTAGSITPGANGDLLYQATFIDSSASLPLTGITVGSQSNITWELIGAEKVNGTVVQYGVYTSTSAINPTLTIAPTANFISIVVALKSASAGTAPGTGIRVLAVQHCNTHDETTAAPTFFWPTGALGNTNLLVIAYISSSARSITSITDSSSNTWTQAGSGAANNSSCQIWYAKNATAAGLLTITVNISGSNGGGHGETFMAFEIAGADTSAPLDTTSSATGDSTVGSPITADTITPSTSNGLVISILGVAFDSVTGITTTGAEFISIRSTGEVEPSSEDENNGWALSYNPNTSSITNTWTYDNVSGQPAGNWAAFSAAFKAPGAPIPMPPLLGLRTDVLLRM